MRRDKQFRKLRILYPKKPPMVRSYVIAGGLPLVHDVSTSRWVETEKTPSDSYTIVPKRYLRRRNLRWFTKEKYDKFNGLYFNKKDRKSYKVFQRNHKNPHLRYYYYKIVTKKKRVYRDERYLNKPYFKNVLDIIDAGEAVLKWEEPSTSMGPLQDILINAPGEQALTILAAIAAYFDDLFPLEQLPPEVTSDQLVYRHITNDGNEFYFNSPRRSSYEPGINYEPVETDDYPFDVNYEPFLRYNGELRSFSVQEFPEALDVKLESLLEVLRPFGQFLTPVYEESDNVVQYELKAHYLSSPRDIIDKDKGILRNPLWGIEDNFDFTANMRVKADVFKSIGIFDYIGYKTFLQLTHDPLRGAPDMGTLLGEMPETLKTGFSIIFLVADLCKLIKQRKFIQCYERIKTFSRGRRRLQKEFLDVAQSAIGLDFLWKFGISPLIQEIQAIIALCDSLGDSLSQKPLRRRYRLNHEDSIWRDVEWKMEHDDAHTVGVGHYNIWCQRNINVTGTIDFCSGGNVHIKNPVLFLLESTGLTNILGTAWELFPLSFVIDWFIRVKDMIGLLNPIQLESYYISNMYVTSIIKYEIKETLSEFSVNGFECEPTELINTYKGVSIFRGTFTPDLTLRIRGEDGSEVTLQDLAAFGLADSVNSSTLSIPKLRTALELIVQRARS